MVASFLRLFTHKKHDLAIAAVLFAVLAAPLWIDKYPRILDFPNHLTRVAIARFGADPVFGFASYYRFSWHPTYAYFDVTTYLLSFIFGVFNAGKLALSLYVLLLICATRYLLKSIQAPLFPFILWPALISYNWWFLIGSINLLAGFCLGMFAIGIAWEKSRNGFDISRLGMVTPFILLSAACHPISAMASCAIIIPILLSSIPRAHLRWTFLSIFLMALVSMEILGHAYFHQPWEPLYNLERINWLLHDFYADAALARPMKLALGAALCLWCVKKKDVMRSLFTPVILVLLIVLTPHSIALSGDNDMRFSMFLFFLVPWIVPSPKKTVWTVTYSAVIISCALWWNFPQVLKQHAMQPMFAEIEAIARTMPDAPRIRPVVMMTGSEEDEALMYLTFYRGGFIPFLFASPIHGLRYIKKPDCREWESFNRLDSACASFYDFIVAPTFGPGNPHLNEQMLASYGFAKKARGDYFAWYAKPSR